MIVHKMSLLFVFRIIFIYYGYYNPKQNHFFDKFYCFSHFPNSYYYGIIFRKIIISREEQRL